VALRAGNNWATGEWLINYAGGFVRRGFFGELLLRLTPEGNSAIYVLLLLQFAFVVYIWIFLLQFAAKNTFSSNSLILILSPAGISFLSWDKYLYVRKEILGIVLVIFVFKLLNLELKVQLKMILANLAFVWVVLSSEVNLFFLPSLIFLIATSKTIERLHKVYWIFSFLLVSSILVFVTVAYSGNLETSSSVCTRLLEHGLQPDMNCRGAVAMIGVTLGEAFEHVVSNLPGSLIYFLILIFSLFPIYKCWPRDVTKVWIAAVFLGVSPLFFIAWDYGRWVFIIFFQLSLIVIFGSREEVLKLGPKSTNGLILVGYTTLWGFAHTGNVISNGWIGLFPSSARYLVDLYELLNP